MKQSGGDTVEAYLPNQFVKKNFISITSGFSTRVEDEHIWLIGYVM